MNVFGLVDAVRCYPIIGGGMANEEGASMKVVRGACLLVFLLCVTYHGIHSSLSIQVDMPNVQLCMLGT